jgi:hypothetical protein
MTDIKFASDMAGLAEAAYALFDLGKTTQETLIDSGFSSAQATAFVSNWTVVDHRPDTSTGFSATIFQSKDNGEYTLAIRGTAQTNVDLIGAIASKSRRGCFLSWKIDIFFSFVFF